jgi:hypothetical protein
LFYYMTHFICCFYPQNKLLSRRFLWFRMVQNVGMLYSPRVTSREVIITFSKNNKAIVAF